MKSLFNVAILFTLINFIYLNKYVHSLPKSEFDECVQKCGEQYEDCTALIRSLWRDFSKNKKQIMRVMNSCCLAGQADYDQPASRSFATCVRVNCGAELWGCNIKKRHTGFLSEQEKKFILDKEKREKKQKET